MTIICAYRTDDGTWIGADTQITENELRCSGGARKWTVAGRWAIAVAGVGTAFNIVSEHHAELLGCAFPGPAGVRNKLSCLLRGAGANPRTEGLYFPDFGADLLLVGPDAIYDFDSCLSYGEVRKGFVARGSGMRVALGAAYVAERNGAAPEDVVRLAVEAACAIDTACGGVPFVGFMPA